ncbi:MAG: class I SAM-dependent methyltransferase, partial [Alphaproteobacteria bacterium]
APLPQGEEKARAVRTMFDTISPRYDLVNRIMTFRLDVGWRRRTVAALIGKPEATLRGWINRGLAYPDREPYGSFAVDYMRAERGIATKAAE